MKIIYPYSSETRQRVQLAPAIVIRKDKPGIQVLSDGKRTTPLGFFSKVGSAFPSLF